MNIFVLDLNPIKAAEYHCDKHIAKLLLESAQMLSTVLGGRYKPTHKNHPCTLWVSQSRQNAEWLITLTYALNKEWRERYGHNRDHKSIEVVDEIVNSNKILSLPNAGLTAFAQAMPEEYRQQSAVDAYRSYYRSKPFVAWNRGPSPEWW